MSVVQFVATGAERVFEVVTAQAGEELQGSMPADRLFIGPDARPAVGALGVLLDDVLGYTIISSLPRGAWTVSTEIWIDMVRPLGEVSGKLSARARSVTPGSFSAGELYDETGGLVAVCRQRGREIADPPDFANPREDAGCGDHDHDAGSLTGVLGLVEVGDELTMPIVPCWENPRGVLHGGVSLAATEAAATHSRVLAGSDLPTSSVHIVHTRPVPSGVQLEMRTRTVHAGRTLWITDVDAVWNDKICATTRVSAQA